MNWVVALRAVVFVVLGLRLIFFSEPWTSTLHFLPGGFTIRVNTHFTKREDLYHWSDIAEFSIETATNR